ncbi:hydrolase 2, exosortase A system-associated [Herbaspirillum robiniae]|nr:hydrolase 2, exosortase A system-associated [Herbaspirillum robiniae]
MSGQAGRLPRSSMLPMFLPATPGARFCLYHAPAPGRACRGGFVYVQPFAEEMNRSRRMASLQAAALAEAGFGVLVIDLLGCGDSSGDSGDATWPQWQADVLLALRWLRSQLQAPVGLWGLRLGALLALDVARMQPHEVDALLLWNPVLDGKSFMTQFLRLRLAAGLTGAHGQGAPAGGVKDLRAQLEAGQMLEIAGYDLNPALAHAIDALQASALTPPPIPCHWLEVVRDADAPPAPAQSAVLEQWHARQAPARLHQVAGPAFWSTPEITSCQPLIELSCALALEGLRDA